MSAHRKFVIKYIFEFNTRDFSFCCAVKMVWSGLPGLGQANQSSSIHQTKSVRVRKLKLEQDWFGPVLRTAHGGLVF